jgi:hypothetical protein
MLNSITSMDVAWCDGGVSPVVDGVGSKTMRALVNYPVNCCAWRGVSHKLDDMWLAITCTRKTWTVSGRIA